MKKLLVKTKKKIDKTPRYTIEYHKQMEKWVLWKEINTEHGFAVKGIFNGTKQQCEIEKIKQLKKVRV